MAPQPERRPRVVLADDYPAVLDALGRMLATSCDVVATVADGAQAVETVATLEPDVLVVDLMLPDIDGLEVCRRVKQRAPQTAVVIITASDDMAVRAAALRDGVAEFVPKHLAAERLGPTIARVFGERQSPV
jgi:CheY-like chemotaxis protein